MNHRIVSVTIGDLFKFGFEHCGRTPSFWILGLAFFGNGEDSVLGCLPSSEFNHVIISLILFFLLASNFIGFGFHSICFATSNFRNITITVNNFRRFSGVSVYPTKVGVIRSTQSNDYWFYQNKPLNYALYSTSL